MYLTIYLNEDEHAWLKAQEKGTLRRLVQEAIYEQGPADAPRTVEEAIPVQKTVNEAYAKEGEMLARVRKEGASGVRTMKGLEPLYSEMPPTTRPDACKACGSPLIARASKCLVCGAKV